MEVRDLEWRDFEGWAELYFTRYDEIRTNPELWIHTHESKPTLSDEAALFGRIWKDVLSGDHVASVGLESGKLIGLCTVHRKGQHVEDRHIGTLGIAVHPDWRGRGLGGRLIPHVLKKCEGRFEVVQLTVTETNVRARALYRKFGFVESGRFPRAFKRGDAYVDDILMWKLIGDP
ncbi:MAG TPA: GNAT family N-acetyltransferase [Thermoplasmata archaeon]|nr:GNAT family N-acetyltransferase [Thermoplasmata archaeon]